MSSSTPNLNLVLPVGSEHVSRAIINENNTKIDTGFGTLSEQIANKNVYIPSSFQNNYNTVFSNMGNVTGCRYDIMASGASNAPYTAYGMCYTVKRYANETTTVGIQIATMVNNEVYKRTYNNGTWSDWQKLATKSDLSIVTATYTFSNVGSGTGTWTTVQLSVPSGKTLLMATIYQSSGLNLVPVWIKNVSSNAVDVMVWNGRTSAADVGVMVVGLCW